MQMDDGYRVLGVSIGDVITLIHPRTGRVLFEIPSEDQPGGWLLRRDYHMVKDGATWWELTVDGRRVFRVPYEVAADTEYGVVLHQFGWADETVGATGTATWDRIETSVGLALPPHWKVDRQRGTFPLAMQDVWTDRHEAILRGIVGLSHATGDRMDRAAKAFTAGMGVVQAGAFEGDVVPSEAGWTENGGSWSVVNGRVRLAAGVSDAWAEFEFEAPEHPESAIWYVSVDVLVRQLSEENAFGRVGPFVQVLDGNRSVGATFWQFPVHRAGVSVFLTNDPLGTGLLDDVGQRPFPVGTAEVPHRIELMFLGRDRVVLFVDGTIVDDLPYDMWTTATTTRAVRVGRIGSDSIAEFTRARAQIRYVDSAYRPLFLRRVAERLLFSGGCESNARLDAWMRHLPGVTQARGTDRVITEISRLACDDDAVMTTERLPAAWFLDVTYPEITPVFLVDAGTLGSIRDRVIEIHPHAPNFTFAELVELFETYLLPRNLREDRARVALATFLTTDPVTGGGESEFEVESAAGFEVGDAVTLRKVVTGDLITLEYTPGAYGANLMGVMILAGVSAGGGQVIGALWTTLSPGTPTISSGEITVTGQASANLSPVSAGGVVAVVGMSAAVDTWATLYGVSGGVGASERIRVTGTTPTIGTVQWDAGSLFGVRIDDAQPADVEFYDSTAIGVPLYIVAAAATTSGVEVVDLLTRASEIELVADAATTNVVIVAGSVVGPAAAVEAVTLAGVVPVTTADEFLSARVLALGDVPDARTLTVADGFVDPSSSGIRVVSTSILDTTQQVRVVMLDTSGTARFVDLALDGTTPVTAELDYRVWRIAGVVLTAIAIGTVRVQSFDGGITYANVAPLSLVEGVDLRKIENRSQVAIVASANPPTPRWVVALGRDDEGNLAVEAVPVSTTSQRTVTSWSEFYGLATGDVPALIVITTIGSAWRYGTWEAIAAGLADSYAWTATRVPTSSALDGQLDVVGSTSVIGGPTAFTGRWSETENVTILEIVEDTITTTELVATFATGDTMRQQG